jgi:hypothetical protein
VNLKANQISGMQLMFGKKRLDNSPPMPVPTPAFIVIPGGAANGALRSATKKKRIESDYGHIYEAWLSLLTWR